MVSCITKNLFCKGSLVNLYPLSDPAIIFFGLLGFFAVVGLVFIPGTISWLAAEEPESEFGTELEQLTAKLDLNIGQMAGVSFRELTERACALLIAHATHAKELQGPRGEKSWTHMAVAARDRYGDLHDIFFSFGLAEAKWCRYWDPPAADAPAAQPEKATVAE